MFTLLELGPGSREEDNFELQVRAPRWAGAASREQREGAGSLPFPVHVGRRALQNNGRNHIPPSCPGSQSFSDKQKNNDITGQASFLQLGEATGARPAAGDLTLPPSSYWTCKST